MPRRLAGYLLKPWFLALLFTLLLVWLIPFGKSKYVIQVDNLINRPGAWQDYHDLNHDGVLEKIYLVTKDAFSFIAITSKDRSIDQWNINGKFHDYPDFITYGDITGDGNEEVFVFYERNDSLFLCCINAYYEPGFHFQDLFIDRLHRKFNSTWYEVNQPQFYDSNQDGVPELYFSLYGAYAIQPRDMYKVDFVSRKVTRSNLGYTRITGFAFGELSKNGSKDLLINTGSSANVHEDSLLYNDRFTWLMAMDGNLRFLFSPVKLFPIYSVNIAVPLPGEGRFFEMIYYESKSQSMLVLAKYNQEGTILDSAQYPVYIAPMMSDNFSLRYEPKFPWVCFDEQGNYYSLDTALHMKYLAKIDPNYYFKNTVLFDEDSVQEYLFYAPKKKEWIITSENLNIILRIPVGAISIDQPFFLTILEKDRRHIKFSLTNTHFESMITCTHNPWYYWRFVIYILIYAALLALFNHLRHVWENQVRERMSAEKSMLQLQLSSLASQLDPHLTFNLLNNVSYILLKHDENEIHRSFTRLTSYIRNSLVKSGMLVITLREELEFTSAYLELQKALMKERLDWSVTVTPEVPPEFRIPRMCLQNLVENAIKHGLRPKPEGGTINIRIERQNDKVVISVRDNGIGKGTDSVMPESGSGKGLGILREFFALLNRINAEKASMSFEYLADEQGHPAGAESLIIIPVDYRYQ